MFSNFMHTIGRIVTFNNKLKPDFSEMTLISQDKEKKNYYV